MNDKERFSRARTIIETNDIANHLVLRELTELVRSIADVEYRSETREDMVRKLFRSQHGDLAREVANLIELPFERSEAFNELGEYFYRQGEKAASEACLDEARRAGLAINEPWQKGERLARVAQAFFDLGLHTEALSLWEIAVSAVHTDEHLRIQDDCGGVLSEISGMLNSAGYRDRAREVAASIKGAGHRERALAQLDATDLE